MNNLSTIWFTNKKLLHFKLTKLGQILHVDKTGFPRLTNTVEIILRYLVIHM